MQDDHGDAFLDDLFATARKAAPTPDAGLVARVLADADASQPRPQPLAPRVQAPPLAPGYAGGSTAGGGLSLGGIFGALADVFGGRGALAGMTLATLTGLWLGVASPQPVSTLISALSGEVPLESLDLLPASDSLWSESQ